MINARALDLVDLGVIFEDMKERELNDIKTLSKQKKKLNKLLSEITSEPASSPSEAGSSP